ncbi:hypothetical protein ACSST1_19315 [Pantoea agglomerans]|uniref:hypothetical protein n=1 Tax=Enterobacter agglomerans TaxID=549 RepID=UPI003EDA43D2
MNILFNELSLKEDIDNPHEFYGHVKELMLARKTLLNRKIMISCHRNLVNTKFKNEKTVLEYIMNFSREEKIDFLNWITKNGPFWEEKQLHAFEDYFSCFDSKVTGSALAEAAAHIYCENNYQTFSIQPSVFGDEIIPVILKLKDKDIDINVKNHISLDSIELENISNKKDIESWDALEEISRDEFKNLTFTEESFHPIKKMPFYKAASTSIIEKLKVLNDIKISFDSDGRFSSEGKEIYRNHFTGDKAWFTDSSDGEKRDFSNEMKFLIDGDERLFCTWHGKVKTPQIRIHFSYPITQKSPLYIVYVGEKITKS